jgi:hypothetical protein
VREHLYSLWCFIFATLIMVVAIGFFVLIGLIVKNYGDLPPAAQLLIGFLSAVFIIADLVIWLRWLSKIGSQRRKDTL